MNTMRLIAIYFIGFYFLQSASAHPNQFQSGKKIPLAKRVEVDSKSVAIKFIEIKENATISKQDGFNWFKENIVKYIPHSEFRFKKETKDDLGFEHVYYEQWINEYQVEHSIYKLHYKNKHLVSLNGEYYIPQQSVSSEIILSIDEAKAIANNVFIKSGINEAIIETKLVDLVYYHDTNNQLQLCYKFDVNASPSIPKRSYVYIAAANGDVIHEESRIQHTAVNATALTKYHGAQQITVDSINSTTYYLRESGLRNIHTWNLSNSTSYAAASEFTNNSKNWNLSAFNRPALDAHYGAEKTWDYYLQKHNLNSFDGLGTAINSYINYSTNFSNAFWNGTAMTYGDGDGINYTALTSTDIVGHEITHAVTQYAAGLIYANESGALNESFSDIFGTVIDFYANPSTANFLLGEQVASNGIPFRNLGNPNSLGDPNTYLGVYWDFINQAVHNNSAVQNYWFYLLCNGGTGTNDNGDSYSVNAITMAKAAQIAYRTLNVYLTPNSNYTDARNYSIQSALDLYGVCSNEWKTVNDAWHAVGLGVPSNFDIKAGFISYDKAKCSSPASVSFINQSFSNATNFIWDFGDGDTSHQKNPTHTYMSQGNYTVKLIASGNTTCGKNIDTLISNNYIQISNTAGPVASACIPVASSYCCNNGIGNVKLSNINFTSGNGIEGGYKDFTCGNIANLVAGDPYLISVTTLSTNPKIVVGYIDYDNNGSFTTAERAFVTPKISGIHSAYIFTPTSATLNTPLRIRILSSDNTILNACNSVLNGQVEDYSAIFTPATGKPTANFLLSADTIDTSTGLGLTDLSTSIPTSWNWSASGGVLSSNSSKNTSATFNTPGNYTIQLIATNGLGIDTITKTVTVLYALNLCNASNAITSAEASGILYDSGGPSGVYGSNQNCTLLISPPCSDTIEFIMNNILLENNFDLLKIYDGVNASAPLLLQATGNVLPNKVKAASGNLFIKFTSDVATNLAGFKARWKVTYPWQPKISKSSNLAVASNINFNINTTHTIINYLWNFGDGTNTSSLPNPTHSYSAAGIYAVTLQITDNTGCIKTITDTLNIISLGLNHFLNNGDIKLYPNPSSGQFKIVSDNNKIDAIKVYDQLGRKVYENNNFNDVKAFLDLSSVQQGVYNVEILINDRRINKQLVISNSGER
jgi:Zn-dependent metalloprotease